MVKLQFQIYLNYQVWLVDVKYNGGNKMNKNILIAVILVVLVAVSVIQTVQLTSLKSKVSDSGVSLKGSSSSVSVKNTQTTTSSSLDNLPSMVGGC